MNHKQIIDALNWRYATKAFDTNKKVSDEDFQTILEAGRLAPSSFGIEGWKFLVIKNPELRQKIRAVGYDQPQITDASHLIIVARRTDSSVLVGELIARTAATQGKTKEDLVGLEQMVKGSMSYKGEEGVTSWLTAQTYIALGTMIETAALLEIDTCPMEGFDSNAVNEILGLSAQNLSVVTILPVGYRGEDKYSSNPKTRREMSEVVVTVE